MRLAEPPLLRAATGTLGLAALVAVALPTTALPWVGVATMAPWALLPVRVLGDVTAVAAVLLGLALVARSPRFPGTLWLALALTLLALAWRCLTADALRAGAPPTPATVLGGPLFLGNAVVIMALVRCDVVGDTERRRLLWIVEGFFAALTVVSVLMASALVLIIFGAPTGFYGLLPLGMALTPLVFVLCLAVAAFWDGALDPLPRPPPHRGLRGAQRPRRLPLRRPRGGGLGGARRLAGPLGRRGHMGGSGRARPGALAPPELAGAEGVVVDAREARLRRFHRGVRALRRDLRNVNRFPEGNLDTPGTGFL